METIQITRINKDPIKNAHIKSRKKHIPSTVEFHNTSTAANIITHKKHKIQTTNRNPNTKHASETHTHISSMFQAPPGCN